MFKLARDLGYYVVDADRIPRGHFEQDGKLVTKELTPSQMKFRNPAWQIKPGQLVEMDTAGKEIRTIAAGNTASWAGVEPLANGNFLVALYGVNKVVEIDSAGKEVWHVNVQNPSYATRLKNGNTLVATPEGKKVAEFDRAGKEVWKTTTQGRVWRVRRY